MTGLEKIFVEQHSHDERNEHSSHQTGDEGKKHNSKDAQDAEEVRESHSVRCYPCRLICPDRITFSLSSLFT